MSDITVTDSPLPSIAGLQLCAARVPSTLDGALQPVIVGAPEQPCAMPTPLLVGLHTWSADVRQQVESFGTLCARYGWLMVLPNFRGPNLTTNPHSQQAGGSLPAQRDIVDAVDHVRCEHDVDASRIYLIGGSGGGHMSLLMAGKHPELWAGVSSWCPITSLAEWHAQGNDYAKHVEAVCGGPPCGAGVSGRNVRTCTPPEVAFEYERRSPRTFITNAAHTNVRVSHGDKDRCIPVAQTWRTMERLLDIPHRVEFYTWSGGHEIVNEWGFAWLAQQVKPAAMPRRLDLVSDEGKWYYWLYLEPDAPLAFARGRAEWTDGSTLELTVEHSALTRVKLTALSVRAPAAARHDGQDVPVAALGLADGCLTLPPASAPTDWEFTFG